MDRLNKLSSPWRIYQLTNSFKSLANIWKKITLSKDQLGLTESNSPQVFISSFKVTNWPQSTKTGSTTKLLLLPEKSTPDQELESDSSLTFMEVSTEENADQKDINKPVLKLSDGDYNNSKSKKSSRKIRREIHSKSTPESSLMKEEVLWTESSLNTSNPNKHDFYKFNLLICILFTTPNLLFFKKTFHKLQSKDNFLIYIYFESM